MKHNSITHSIEYLLDKVIDLLVSSVLSIPILSDLTISTVKKVKGFLLLLPIISVIVICGTVDTFTADLDTKEINLPNQLNNYLEDSLQNNLRIRGSPLGENHYHAITAKYMDANYFKQFGFEHNGIDLIPSQSYYQENQAYRQTSKIILFATLSGNACSSGDINTGYTVTIETEKDKVLYHHQEENFIPINSCTRILSGTPIGVMGETGNATGIHVHYMTYKKDKNGAWVHYNPELTF